MPPKYNKDDWLWVEFPLAEPRALEFEGAPIEIKQIGPKQKDGSLMYRAFLPVPLLSKLHGERVAVSIDTTAETDPRVIRNWVSSANRFEDVHALMAFDPFSPLSGEKYFNLNELNTYLMSLAGLFPRLVEFITLPNITNEGRATFAVRIGQPNLQSRSRIDSRALLISGMHGREWGGPDILIAFIDRVIKAFNQDSDLQFGRWRLPAATLRNYILHHSIIIAPCLNPDGLNFSQTYRPSDASDRIGIRWRKNRNPRHRSQTLLYGTDPNRNMNFLWKHGDDDPKSPFFHGDDAPQREPESRNVAHLISHLTGTSECVFVDVHNFGRLILSSWGNAPIGTDSSLNFATAPNPTSCDDPCYSEFMETSLRQALSEKSELMREAATNASGRNQYRVRQVHGVSSDCCSCGTTTDFATTRFLLGERSAPILAFTYEFGDAFQQRYDNFIFASQDCCAALAAAIYT